MRKILLVSMLLAAASCRSQPTAMHSAAFDPGAFPILGWELPKSKYDFLGDPSCGLASMKEADFNVAAFVTPDQLPQCEKLHMPAIVATRKDVDRWTKLTDEQIDARVHDLVKA